MKKNRLTYVLKQLTMTPEEFAAVSRLSLEKLKAFDKNPDSQTTEAIVGYFVARDHPQEKRILLNLLSGENERLVLDFHNLYDALADYLCYAPALFNGHYIAGRTLPQCELYPAQIHFFQGTTPTLHALELFCHRAFELRELENALIFCSVEDFSFKKDALHVLSHYALPLAFGVANSLPLLYYRRRLLTAILPNHCLLEILDAQEPLALLSCDAAKANSAWLGIGALGAGAADRSKPLCNFRLSYLFDLTGMRNDTLAKLLFVDKTLVSKWRNGRRKLGYYDGMLRRIAEAFVNSGSKNRQKLQTLTKARSREELLSCLCRWISYRDNKTASASCVPYFSYLGAQGARDAIQALLQYCRQCRPPLKIQLFCLDHPEYLACISGFLTYLADTPCRIQLNPPPGFSQAGYEAFVQQNLREIRTAVLLGELQQQGKLHIGSSVCSAPYNCRLLLAIPGMALLNFSWESGAPDCLQVRACYDGAAVDKFLSTSPQFLPVAFEK